MNSKISLPTIATWIIFAVLVFVMGYRHKQVRFQTQNTYEFRADMESYYGYLTAAMVYGDMRHEQENGTDLIGTTMGLSLFYSPFFIVAHMMAPYFHQPQNGCSPIYQLLFALASFFYVMIALLVLKRILLKYFSPLATALTLLAIGLGSNLFFYTAHKAPLPHASSFALITLFLYLVIRWYEEPNERKSVFLGFVFGLIVLIKPSNLIAGILFLGWGVNGLSSLRVRIGLLLRNWRNLIVLLVLFLSVWIPQLIYWKALTGTYIFNFYSLSGNRFLPDSPFIGELLFSFSKGWFIYTPVMLLACAGFIFLRRRIGDGIPVILIYLIVQVYLLSGWSHGWSGSSFGLRSFVDIYGVMALPLAALVDRALKHRRVLAIGMGALLAFLVYVNQVQTYQYTRGIIGETGMTKEDYWLNFLKPQGASTDSPEVSFLSSEGRYRCFRLIRYTTPPISSDPR